MNPSTGCAGAGRAPRQQASLPPLLVSAPGVCQAPGLPSSMEKGFSAGLPFPQPLPSTNLQDGKP